MWTGLLWCRLRTDGESCECSNWPSRVFKMLEISSVTDEIFDTDELSVLWISLNFINNNNNNNNCYCYLL